MRLVSLFILLSSFAFFSACNNSKFDEQFKKANNYIPESTGSIDEILLVMENDIWEGELGEFFIKYFMQDYTVLPQPEPYLDLYQIPGAGFLNILKRSSTVLIACILEDESPTTDLVKEQIGRFKQMGKDIPPFFVRKDVWAKPQRVIYLYGNTAEDLKKVIVKNETRLLALLREVEDQKVKNQLRVPGVNEGLTETVKAQFNIKLDIPGNFKVALENEDFLWFRQDDEAKEEIFNLMIHSQPYTSKNGDHLHSDYPIQTRDSLGRYVTSSIEGSYMYSHDVLPFEMRYIEGLKASDVVLETRGLWRLKKDFMGGPFLTYCIDDKINKRIITLDGFVYAPKSKKRNLVRKMEMLFQQAELIN